MTERNFGTPIVHSERPWPPTRVHEGSSVRLTPLRETDAEELWPLVAEGAVSFDYLRYGPFDSLEAFRPFLADIANRPDQPFWAVRPTPDDAACGWLSLCDIYPRDSSIEIGSVWFSPRLQRTRASTEAVFLLMRHAFDDLGYERLVWRCAEMNEASRGAALRYGFTFEGVWRNSSIVKGFQRGVAWHSMLKHEWPENRAAIEAWLCADNFDQQGRARASLGQFRQPG